VKILIKLPYELATVFLCVEITVLTIYRGVYVTDAGYVQCLKD
jgi:hypothetical protein